MKQILVTGVAGFLGRSLARYFYQKGWEVLGVDLVDRENAPTFLRKYIRLNLPNEELLSFLTETMPDACLHCAGRASVGSSLLNPLADYSQGPALTSFLLNALHLTVPECKVVFFSSAAVYGNPVVLPVSESILPEPISPYGFNKWQGEILCREYHKIYNLPTTSVRIFSAYGPGLRRQVIWDICEKAISHEVVNLFGTGKEGRDFIHTLDIAKGIEVIINSAAFDGEVYNLASGKQIFISDLAYQVLECLNLRSKQVVFDQEVHIGDPNNWQADIRKIKSLGFDPDISFEDGLRNYVNWFQSEWGRGL